MGLRAWTPFVPGDAELSNTPGAVFEVHVRNLTKETQKGTLAFSFPGPTQAEAQISRTSPRISFPLFGASESVAQGAIAARRKQVRGKEYEALAVRADTGTGYAISVIGEEKVRWGGGLWARDTITQPGNIGRGFKDTCPKPQNRFQRFSGGRF